jgi:hypothetical protein
MLFNYNLQQKGATIMATKKAAGKKTKRKSVKGKKLLEGGDPIIIGGGGGLKNPRLAVVGTTIKFNPSWYKNNNPKKPREHGHLGDYLSGLAISSGGGKTTPQINPDSDIVIECRRPPATTGDAVVWISGKDMTINFSDDFVMKNPGKFYCSYLYISDLLIDDNPTFSSGNGDCEISALNALSLKPKRKPRRKS